MGGWVGRKGAYLTYSKLYTIPTAVPDVLVLFPVLLLQLRTIWEVRKEGGGNLLLNEGYLSLPVALSFCGEVHVGERQEAPPLVEQQPAAAAERLPVPPPLAAVHSDLQGADSNMCRQQDVQTRCAHKRCRQQDVQTARCADSKMCRQQDVCTGGMGVRSLPCWGGPKLLSCLLQHAQRVVGQILTPYPLGIMQRWKDLA